MRQPINPHDIAPCSARKVESRFGIYPSQGGLFHVCQSITWKDWDGWDGHFHKIAEGLSQAEAEALAADLNGEVSGLKAVA